MGIVLVCLLAYVPIEVTLNGKPAVLRAEVVGDGEHVVEVDRIFLHVGDGRGLVLRTEEGRVYLGDRLAGVFVGADEDPFEGLTPEQIRGLRGVRVGACDARAAERLSALEPSTSVVTLSGLVECPPLPDSVRHVRIESSSSTDATEFAPLAALKSLRSLGVRILTQKAFDAAWIEPCSELRWLDLSYRKIANPAKLASLTRLRTLLVSGSSGLTDASFARCMPELRILAAQGSALSDLSGFAGHPAIETIDADMAGVKRLPGGELPALRLLRFLSGIVPAAEVEAFAKRNPKCRLIERWDGLLRESLRDADRIRVRSGGLCHRREDKERTLGEEADSAKVRELIESIAVEPGESGFHCMCCGEPTLEIYKGKELIASLGYHHGQSLRWADWPGDAMLTEASADGLADWLAAHGAPEPREDLKRQRESERAARRRIDRYGEILGKETLQAFREARDGGLTEVFVARVPDAAVRAGMALRLYGCDDAPWNLSFSLDEWLATAALPAVTAEDFETALAKADADPWLANGAARWMFWDRKLDKEAGAAFRKHLDLLARHALSHPDAHARRETLEALAGMSGDDVAGVLSDLLQGKLTPRDVPEAERGTPGGMAVFKPRKLPDGSDRALAAHLLAQMGRKECLEAIEALLKTAAESDEELLKAAVAKLRE